MADNVIFKTGALSNLNSVTKKAGQVLFAIDGNNKAYISFDKNANTRCDLCVKVADEATTLTGLTASATDLNDINNKANKQDSLYYIEGTGDTAGAWLGSHDDIIEYYAGLTVAYKVGIAGVSEGTTLNINNLGAVAVIRNTTSAVTTHYGVSAVIILTYTVDSSGTAYWKVADYDSDTKTRSSNKASTKMYIIGAQSQSTSGQTTYSNSKCYIGTDNCLYSNGSKVALDSNLSTLSTTVNSTINSLTISGKTITYTTVDGTTNTLTTQDTVYTLPIASSTVLGGVKVGDNINLNNGIISLNKDNVYSALGYTPVNKAGDTMTDWLYIKSDYTGVGFLTDDGLTRSQIIAVPSGTNGSGLRFGVKATNSDNWEFYTLPYSNTITGHKYYSILTTRDTLTIAQGGTGATTAIDACSNLGAVKKSGDTMSGDLTVSNSGVARIKTTCGSYSIGLFAQGSETGLYDYGKSKYVIWGQNGNYTFHGTADYFKYFSYTNINNAVDSAQNLNYYTTPGSYVCSMSASAANMLNCPVSIAFTLLVLPNAGCTQILIPYGSSNKDGIYVRNYYNGNWYSWRVYQTNVVVSGS